MAPGDAEGCVSIYNAWGSFFLWRLHYATDRNILIIMVKIMSFIFKFSLSHIIIAVFNKKTFKRIY